MKQPRSSPHRALKPPLKPGLTANGKPRQSLGSAIKEARTKAQLTQLQLAHRIGYQGDDAGAYISRVESNNQEPRIDTLCRIAEALGVTVCGLLP